MKQTGGIRTKRKTCICFSVEASDLHIYTRNSVMSTQIENLLPYSQLDLVKNSYISVPAALRNS